MRVILIDRPEYRWFVLLDDAGGRHRYVRGAAASTASRPDVRILSHGLVRFTEANGLPVLDGRSLPDSLVVERQGDCYTFIEQ